MRKFFGIAGGIMLLANVCFAQQEGCDCGHSPYVTYELSEPLELYETAWRVVYVERFDFDLTQVSEPEVCVAYLELIPPTKSYLYEGFQNVPEGDMELYVNGAWTLASEFENQMDESGCDIAGTLS